MSQLSRRARTKGPPGSARPLLALSLALAMVTAAMPRAAVAEDWMDVRPLPPVISIESVLPDAPTLYSGAMRARYLANPPGARAEQTGYASQHLLAPGDPPFQLLSRQQPLPDYHTDAANAAPLPPYYTAWQDPPGEASKDDTTPFADEPPKPTPADEDAKKDDKKPQDKKDGEPQKLGREPVNNSMQFLRTESVLLEPCDWQFDTGFAYTLFDDQFPVALLDNTDTVVGVIEGRVRDRLIYTPLAFRYGWTTNVQLFGVLPTGFADTQLSTIGESIDITSGGIGDLTSGVNVHLIDGKDKFPDVIGTLAVTAPTGDFNAPVFGVIPGTALGQGFWAFSAQLLFINTYDPIVAFYGVGYRHLFEREFADVLFQPGEQINYQFGVGFAANDRVTLSASFQGFYITNTLLDRTALAGTNVEPMSLRFAATIARNDRIIEPFCQVGMTDFAPAASFGITITFYKQDCEE